MSFNLGALSGTADMGLNLEAQAWAQDARNQAEMDKLAAANKYQQGDIAMQHQNALELQKNQTAAAQALEEQRVANEQQLAVGKGELAPVLDDDGKPVLDVGGKPTYKMGPVAEAMAKFHNNYADAILSRWSGAADNKAGLLDDKETQEAVKGSLPLYMTMDPATMKPAPDPVAFPAFLQLVQMLKANPSKDPATGMDSNNPRDAVTMANQTMATWKLEGAQKAAAAGVAPDKIPGAVSAYIMDQMGHVATGSDDAPAAVPAVVAPVTPGVIAHNAPYTPPPTLGVRAAAGIIR